MMLRHGMGTRRDRHQVQVYSQVMTKVTAGMWPEMSFNSCTLSHTLRKCLQQSGQAERQATPMTYTIQISNKIKTGQCGYPATGALMATLL